MTSQRRRCRSPSRGRRSGNILSRRSERPCESALIHRDYFNNTVQTQVRIFDDAIRFRNAGRLPEGVTIEMILREHSSYLRNPMVADIFYRAGLVERYGSGIERIIRAFGDAGAPIPTFSSTPLGFTIDMHTDTLTDDALLEMGLGERQIAAVHYLKEHGTITNSQYQDLSGVSATTALKELKALAEVGILERRSPSKKKTHYVLKQGSASDV
ncbi:ATP-binding protein [Methanofollis ethanolicus]|uniref:ATP-binding protein n=1 Tax=Methanofollis ethanolicus TaxID=488124 RepID=UPI000833C6B4|nr:ATP-binding protein [Methanofollis ethanolicus]